MFTDEIETDTHWVLKPHCRSMAQQFQRQSSATTADTGLLKIGATLIIPLLSNKHHQVAIFLVLAVTPIAEQTL